MMTAFRCEKKFSLQLHGCVYSTQRYCLVCGCLELTFRGNSEGAVRTVKFSRNAAGIMRERLLLHEYLQLLENLYLQDAENT